MSHLSCQLGGPRRQERIRAGLASRPAGRASELSERAFVPARKGSEPAEKERKRKKEQYNWYAVIPKAIIPYRAAAQKQVTDGRTIQQSDGATDGRTLPHIYRIDARMHLERSVGRVPTNLLSERKLVPTRKLAPTRKLVPTNFLS